MSVQQLPQLDGLPRYVAWAAAAAASLFLISLVQALLSSSPVPKNIPIIGVKPGQWIFPLTRARIRNIFNLKANLASMYQHHKHETSVLPVLGIGDLVFVPIREIQWLADQPDTIVSSHELFVDFLETDHTIPGSNLAHDTLPVQTISTKLTRETGNLIPAMYDESRRTADELWGVDADWKKVDAMPDIQHMIAQVISRVFVGAPLCRDKKLQDLSIAFTSTVPLGALMVRLIWSPLRPLLAPIVTMPSRLQLWRFFWVIRDEVERRLALHDARQDPDSKAEEPNDFLQWSIQQAKALGDPHQYDPYVLSRRLMLINFSSIHTSSMAVTHALLDLAKNPKYIEELRQEITQVFERHDGQWNKSAVADMPKLDSAMRESQRLNNGNFFAVVRKVIDPKGITTPSGVHLPYGTIAGAPGYTIHHDETIYPDPDEYRPFRFSDMAADLGKQAGEGKASTGKRSRYAWVTTSPDYTAFGHGRYACPGRFFASAELKILLAYLILNYDIETLPQPPLDLWRVGSQVSGLRPRLRVKRRL